MKQLYTFLILVLSFSYGYTQQKSVADFSIDIEQVSNTNAPDLQSFISAQSDGNWLLVGGRTNGLHGFPNTVLDGASFPPQYENNLIYVYDPEKDSVWSRSLYTDLPVPVVDQLSSVNAESYQLGNTLYFIGGYGKDSLLSSAGDDSLVTFNKITAINVSGVINAIKSNSSIAPFIRQYADSRMEVTGGELNMIGNDFYLVGGQTFTGQYTFSTTFVQEYTNQVRKFDIVDNGETLSLTNYSAYTDTSNLKRRDLNVTPIITSQSGGEGLAIYGGVFTDDELPWNNPVFISSSGYTTDFNYTQKFSQYTCPVISLYDSVSNKMSSILMGGLSLYRFDRTLNLPVIDSCDFGSGPVPCIPYVCDISVISKFADGSVQDSVLPVIYPNGQLVGTNAALLLDPGLPIYGNGVIKYNAIKNKTFAGYVYGGIEAIANNPPDGGTHATNKIFKVFITPGSVTGVQPSNSSVPGTFTLFQNYPNPFNPTTRIAYELPKQVNVSLKIYDIMGREVATLVNGEKAKGRYEVEFNGSTLASGVYFYKLQAGNFSQARKFVLLK
ncbi:MAG: T9SS type A sorting domain-containing protein [Ignavibacteriaceae bacterium]|nr:T9SS type A sorting domain-containing protein [Ignavibacteriaceae bacterium]